MQTRFKLTALAAALTIAAAPLAADQIKPVKPTTSTQAGAVALGSLGPAAAAALAVGAAVAVAVVVADGSSDDTSSTTE